MKFTPRRSPTSLAISIALHVVLGVLLVRVVILPMSGLFEPPSAGGAPREHVTYVAVPRAGPPTAGRSGGDGRPKSERPAPPLRAPTSVPSTVPTRPANPAPKAGGAGEIVGRGGAAEGIRPSYGDSRVWVPPADVAGAPSASPKTPAQRLDSLLKSRLSAHEDSLARYSHAPTKAERGDWTFERGGEKYGIDQKWIHLGKFSLPTAALAFLPLNAQANPIAAQREQALNQMRADIQYQAQKALNEEEFRNAVRAIRERKERERAAARRAESIAGKDGSE